MSIATLIIGESGTGKSTSLRNLDPAQTLLIQVLKKPLPFPSKTWKYFDKETAKTGNIFVRDSSDQIVNLMRNTKRKIIVIDDSQYLMANEYMMRSDERGFDKFTDIGRHSWDVMKAAIELPDDVRVYFLSHSDTTDAGKVKAKTIGKLLDDKITVEGMFTIVMRTAVINDQYIFKTRNNGNDTVKTPMALFESEHIENDLKAVDDAIKAYYLTKD